MSANIFGERFLGKREPAWHGLGQVFTEAMTAVDATKLAGLDYEVSKVPMIAKIETPFGTQLQEIAGKALLMREPTADDPEYRYFGQATPDYGVVQNTELATALDILTDDYPVETVGAIDFGKTVFYSLDAGKVEVHGEEVHQYFLVTDTKDGGTSLKIAFTPVRVVCQNTLTAGLKQAVVSAALRHDANVGVTLGQRVQLVKALQNAQTSTLHLFERLAETAITAEDLWFVLEQTYPMPNRPAKMKLLDNLEEDDIVAIGMLYDEATSASQTWEYYCNRQRGFQSAAYGLYTKISDEYPAIAGTAWALWNAVVESADYRNGAESVPASTLFGPRMHEKRRAFKAALSLVK